jgi:uncharacterized protein (TIGR03382 family)
MAAETTGGAARMPTSPAAIERAIAAKRASLAATIDELSLRAQPKEIARRSVAGVSTKAQGAVRTPDGQLRTERIGAVAGAAVVVLVVLVWLRRRR